MTTKVPAQRRTPGTVEITRQMGIDMGHRVPFHAGKCKNVHGHRYLIEATASALMVQATGQESGMITDFGVIKVAMEEAIDKQFDHKLCLWANDKLWARWCAAGIVQGAEDRFHHTVELVEVVEDGTPFPVDVTDVGACMVVKDIPTAENLAALWFKMVNENLALITSNRVWLTKMRVWETPNCYADYIPPAHLSRKYGKRGR